MVALLSGGVDTQDVPSLKNALIVGNMRLVSFGSQELECRLQGGIGTLTLDPVQ